MFDFADHPTLRYCHHDAAMKIVADLPSDDEAARNILALADKLIEWRQSLLQKAADSA